MINLDNIHSLSDFQRKTKEYLERLERTGQPEVLTVNGEARFVVQDAQSYQKLLDELDRAQAIAGIRRGLESVAAGRTQPMDEAFEEIRRKHEIPRRGD